MNDTSAQQIQYWAWICLKKVTDYSNAQPKAQSATDIYAEKLYQKSTAKINLLTQASLIKQEELTNLPASDQEL